MKKKYWFWLCVLIILIVGGWYFYENQNPSGSPRGPGSGLTIKRTDGFPDWTRFPINRNSVELFGFTFNASSTFRGTSASTKDIIIKSITFKVITTSSPSAATTSIRNIRLVSDGVVLGSIRTFTSTTFAFNNLSLTILRNQYKSLHLLADTTSPLIWGDLQFKIFDVNAADSVTGQRIPVIRLPDGAFLSPVNPLESTHFYF